MENLLNLPDHLPEEELLEILWQGPACRVERIVSSGQVSPPGFWYDQPEDEWVLLLQGQAQIGYPGGGCQKMQAGDWLLIPARQKHRVEYTSQDPPCIWLAIFADQW